MIKKCTICEKEYEKEYPGLYCSDECRTEGNRRYQKAWQLLNRKKQKQYLQQYYLDNRKHIIELNKEYIANNREVVLMKARARWHKNKERYKLNRKRGLQK